VRLPTYRELTREQDAVINVPLDQTCLVTGPPGTGKTVIGLYRAQMIDRRGGSTRMLTYSVTLSQYTACAASELKIGPMVTTYHKFMWWFYKSHFGGQPPQQEPYRFDWLQVFQDLAYKPVRAEEKLHLIVDEGQDLPKEFYLVAQQFTTNITVFADGNQTITETSSRIEEIEKQIGVGPGHRYVLTQNFRNTREIAEFANAFCTDPDRAPALPDRHGERPTLKRHTNLNETVRSIIDYSAANPGDRIGVFCFRRGTQKSIFNALRARLPCDTSLQYNSDLDEDNKTRAVDFEQDGVFVFNVQSAKGLEFDAVFVVELQEVSVGADDTKLRAKLYVACTRARSRLFLAYTGATRPPVADWLPQDLIDTEE
jgi:DNA helicase IV